METYSITKKWKHIVLPQNGSHQKECDRDTYLGVGRSTDELLRDKTVENLEPSIEQQTGVSSEWSDCVAFGTELWHGFHSLCCPLPIIVIWRRKGKSEATEHQVQHYSS